jgi:hypothetical protein
MPLDSETKLGISVVSLAVMLLIFLTILGMWGCPKYNVWQQGLQGEAELVRAQQNRQIEIEEAKARKEAASMLAEAEVVRAKGVAEANKIIGESLHGDIGEAYLRYLWIEGLKDSSGERIYIPTEAGIPILEARPKPYIHPEAEGQ